MNLPNKLTLLRVILIPVFLVFLCLPLPLPDWLVRSLAAAVFLAAALTDLWDGKLARKYGLVTNFGKLMDPLADKCMVISAMIALVLYCDSLRYCLAWAAVVVVLRELAVTSLRLLAASEGGEVIAAAWLGKVKTVLQIVCVMTVLLEPVVMPLLLETWLIPKGFFAAWTPLSYLTLLVMTVMTLWSGIAYFVSYSKYLKS